MRNALLPLYTGLLLTVGFMFGGTIILEEIFQYRGMGWYMFEGVEARDYPLMVGGFTVICITVVISMFIADLTYSRVDPRAKTGGDGMEVYGSSTGVPLRTQLKRTFKRFTNGNEKRADGGSTTHAFFGEEAASDVSRKDALYRKFDRSIYAPAKIVLNDWRGAAGSSSSSRSSPSGRSVRGSSTARLRRSRAGNRRNPRTPARNDGHGCRPLSLMVTGTTPVLIMITAGALATVILGVSVGAVAGFRGAAPTDS